MVGVTIRDLVVRYGAGQDSAAAVAGVNLHIRPREMFLLLGPSGCGKTTVLRSVAGFVQPDSGSIHFGDEDVTRLPAHARNAGMVFQSFALWPHLTVAQNVAFGLQEQKVPRKEIRERVEAALASTQMAGFGPRRIDELSGGEQQRVALARALVVRPRCLLLDEPLASLDAKLRRSMREEIRRICKSFGLTTIYVTHDQKEALAIADRVAVMQDGRVLQVGTPSEIYRRPRSRAVAAFVGDTNLLPGRVVSADASFITLESPLGSLVAAMAPSPSAASPAAQLPDVSDHRPGAESGEPFNAHVPPHVPPAGARLWISIRPECLRLVAPAEPSAAAMNCLRGQFSQSVYLGELAEHRIRVADHELSLFEMNPPLASAVPGAEVTVAVHPADVVLLPLDEGDESAIPASTLRSEGT